jgi:hypothetical protein
MHKRRDGFTGGGGAATPAVQLNPIFSARTDPRENPEKKPAHSSEEEKSTYVKSQQKLQVETGLN